MIFKNSLHNCRLRNYLTQDFRLEPLEGTIKCRTRTAIPSFANPSMSDPYLPLFYVSAMNECFQLKPSTPTNRLYIAIFKRFQFCRLRVVQGQLIEFQYQQHAKLTGVADRNFSRTGRSKVLHAQAMNLFRSVLLIPPMGFMSAEELETVK